MDRQNKRFQFRNEDFFARSRKIRGCAEAYFTYAAQASAKFYADIVKKDHLWMETN